MCHVYKIYKTFKAEITLFIYFNLRILLQKQKMFIFANSSRNIKKNSSPTLFQKIHFSLDKKIFTFFFADSRHLFVFMLFKKKIITARKKKVTQNLTFKT